MKQSKEELVRRAKSKALSNLLGLERELTKAYKELEDGGNGSVGPDLLEIVVESTQRQIEVWQFILNSIDEKN